ncbi:MAG TPA: adenine phosphoribosyltransferase [Flavobacteriales bacterium]|jgi:adenine phosphoribosyltransferase|nr:adenine phosphoribosyltransferase [Flavobacteriales bacterium]
MKDLSQFVAEIQNFPKDGILFRDISPLLRNHFPELIDQMVRLVESHKHHDVEYIAGIEARGFIIGAAIAAAMNKGFLPVRKKGKLPPPTSSVNYDLEYGTDALEMHQGSGSVLIVDDVLATGGTLAAAIELCQITGYQVKGVTAVVNLSYLNNFKFENEVIPSLLTY